jgi:hypothetical protein
MSNAVKQSLQDNSDEILANLPDEFHNDFKACVQAAMPTEKLTIEQAKEQAAELMKENPSIADKECVALLDSDTLINQPIQQPKNEELELQKQELISEIEANLESE